MKNKVNRKYELLITVIIKTELNWIVVSYVGVDRPWG